MKVEFNVIDVVVVTGRGTDKILFDTDLPATLYPWNEPLSFKFEVTAGNGEDYLKTIFPRLPYKVTKV